MSGTTVTATIARKIKSLVSWIFKAPTELTIATGAITVTQAYHTVDTESDAATDDLATINGVAEHSIVLLRPANDARTVVLKHGTGNLEIYGNADVSLDDEHDGVLLLGLSSTVAVFPFGGGSGGVSDHGALTGLADDDHTQYLLAAATRASTGIQEFLGLNLTDSTELTIATGAITVTQGFHTVDTESDTASDDLDTINPAGGQGDILIIRPDNGSRTIVVKHGTGNILCMGNSDISLDDLHDCCLLVRINGSNWAAFDLTGASGAGINNVVEDTTPQLGGALDLNGQQINDSNGNEMFKFTETASAVNELTWKNEATGNDPGATASGGDTNIGVDFIPKGSGTLQENGKSVALADASRAITGIQEALGFNLTDATELTIATGAVTVTQGFHRIDTESDAATDDLDTITPAGGAGDILVICAENSARTVVIKHGTGNIQCVGDGDITLDDDHDFAILVRRDASNWMALSRNNSSGGINDVVDDTTPSLGGDLECQGNDVGNIGLFHLSNSTELTISSGAVTITQSNHRIAPESGSADDLDTVNGSGGGYILFIRPTNNTTTITIKHNTGNIKCIDGSDIVLGNEQDFALLLGHISTGWYAAPMTGGGDVTKVGTPVDNQIGVWTGDGTIQGDANLTYEGTGQLLTLLGTMLATTGRYKASTELTISSGSVAKTQTLHTIDTESDAATDDLNQITGGTDGDIIMLRTENDARDVVLKHGVTNIKCSGGSDLTLGTTNDLAIGVFWGSTWYFGVFSSGGGGGISNVVEDTTPQLGGTLDVNGNSIGDQTEAIHLDGGPYSSVITITDGATGTADLSKSNVFKWTLPANNDNRTLAFSNAQNGMKFTIRIDATSWNSGMSATFNWPSGLKWPAGMAPDPASDLDDSVYEFIYYGSTDIPAKHAYAAIS